ncbi:iron-sulfur cluster repair di-iron protein ScdA [Staphylococcus haemolyticus]|uniref:iron-sulfur cluster repair di-iron protein ScdA n=1 Tax=Staphylococcus haemolyticus TaxID=1283 RepID=UPI0015D7BC37|nr:iron-sulfur cluster repair di-iron protein ScdA [Staphylococcus haemolyticus]MCH4382333.1 iron-sulfur cluster repair di-iron protein ScdA [Staphylococcus haemolyticus]MCH4389158.1 iron-sulfur cluster repair di-iron protein ScdA [Staphylococcus haemolyticus]MCH4403423.1 iron-sulfur cluster repair di-iron protein ScdA [Staphylococcus haemolyticus]MCH4518591.1 iron-sulfur cluster repair di-iron protein ScdA [Staphylococcus haemolyticus]MCH4534503.1 iron-sulfur cluster repair di-iron protein Sc
MITNESIVAEIVTDIPLSADIFRKYGIDFCCGGNMSINEAVKNKKVDAETLIDEINELPNHNQGNINVKYLDAASLIQYIQSRYHETMREEFKNLSPYVTKIAKVHGPNHPFLIQLQDLYRQYLDGMLEHMAQEDEHDFPALIKLSRGEQVDHSSDIIQSLVDDHTQTGQLLEDMRELTNQYQPPSEACQTWRLVYHRLENLERETHEHVHLENHVLFNKFS